MRTTPRPFKTLPLLVVDGHLAYEGIPIHAGAADMHLDSDTQAALIQRFPDLEPADGENGNTYSRFSVHHLRIHACRCCAGRYVAHWNAVFCSDACRRQSRQPANTAAKQRRRERSREYRLRHEVAEFCLHCEGRLSAQRTTRKFCSDKCRKAAGRVKG